MKIKQCRTCKVELNYENSYIKNTTNLLCKTHYHKYKNRVNPKTGYSAMQKYELKNNKTKKRKRQFAEIAKRMYQKYPEKWRARSKVSYAVRTGKIIKPKKCESCLKENLKLQAHHEDYTKPLDVMWLCVGCHNNHHHKNPTIR